MNDEPYIDSISGETLRVVSNAIRDKLFYKGILLHRVDGPAVEYNDGRELWARNGRTHRMDGPAVKNNESKRYWIDAVPLDRDILQERLKHIDHLSI